MTLHLLEKLQLNHGEALVDRQLPRELAEVVDYDPVTHTALLRGHTGSRIEHVPQLRPGSNDFELLTKGTIVVVSHDLGFPVIDGVINIPGPPQSVLVAPSVTGVSGIGDTNPLRSYVGVNNHRPPTAPSDLGPGDWAKSGPLGQHVAILEGGVASLGSPSALVRSLGLLGILQTVAKTISTVTDFGNWQVINDGGKTSFSLRAGSCQTTQTGLDEEHWTITLDLGAKGDLFDFQISTPEGKNLFKFHVGADGKTEIYGDGGVDISAGPGGDNEHNSDIAGARQVRIGGDDALSIDGNQDVRIGKAVTANITTDHTCSIGNDESILVNNDYTLSVGGKKTEIISGGSPQTAKPGSTGYALQVLNGDYTISVGDSSSGASPAAMAAYKVTTGMGNIEMSAGMQMKLEAKTTVTVNGSDHPLPKFDTFLQDLGSFLQTLLIALSAGTNGTSAAQVLTNLLAQMGTLMQFVGKVQAAAPYTSMKAFNG